MPLARGWLRQLDTKLNDDMFYKNKPTATSYQDFLQQNAVEYVAVPDARLTYYGKREATLINSNLSYLDPIWKNDHWTLYRVANAVPIVEPHPASWSSETADSITFTAPAEHHGHNQRPLAALAQYRPGRLRASNRTVVQSPIGRAPPGRRTTRSRHRSTRAVTAPDARPRSR